MQDSVRAAHDALETGRTVAAGRHGCLEVADITEMRGGTFFGRAVRYLKQCVFPDRTRRRNHAVIAVLNHQISREFGADHQLNIQTVLMRADSNERFLQSIIDSVGNIRAGSGYIPAGDTEGEVRNMQRLGFAGEVTAPRAVCTLQQALPSAHEQTASSSGETQTAREQLFWYNRTMNDLYNRFPKLRCVRAVSTLNLDTSIENPAENQVILARYLLTKRSLDIGHFDKNNLSQMVEDDVNSGFLTPKHDCSGLIHHEYAHHLSRHVVPEKRWITKLEQALAGGGSTNVCIRYVDGIPGFDNEGQKNVAGSVSKFAATNARECAAEILSWYMNPEYGKSVKRMSDYLENWVRECFPMLTAN